MTITTNTSGTQVINADSGMALRRKTDKGPTQITRVALAAWDSADNWTDCEYAQTEEESAAHVIPASRTFVTADVIEALMKAGIWPQVRAFIEEKGMLDMVLATKEFRADDPNFTGPRDALKELLGWTDGQVEAVLSASVKE